MCGRFAQVIKYDQLQKMQRELSLNITSEQTEISYNVAPTHTVMAVVPKGELRYPGFFRWGLIPSWMKEVPKTAMINIRKETITEKPSFKASFIRRRAIIPANGFYEWRASDKQPHFIQASGSDLIYMAAIYDAWEAADGSFIPSIGIITQDANEFMTRLHHRMPVILQTHQIDAYLDYSQQNPEYLKNLLTELPNDYLRAYPVSREVNKVANNSPHLIEPLNTTGEIIF
jgi:putative SOS response-associated peptidase YedK